MLSSKNSGRLKRRKPLARGNCQLKRSGFLRRKKPMNRISRRRRAERAVYNPRKAAFFREHPFCMFWLMQRGISPEEEREIVHTYRHECGILGRFTINGETPPLATQLHHRNKGRGERLIDMRWCMTTTDAAHDWIEDHKTWAREEGYLLPLEADEDGKLPNGTTCLTTTELMAEKAAKRKELTG